MGGTVKKVLGGSSSAPAAREAVSAPASASSAGSDRGAESAAATRRARRASYRSLLSEARASGEQGVTTLGTQQRL